MYEDLIKKIFRVNALFIDDKQVELFDQFIDILLEQNKVMNLTAITDVEEIIVKHFVDSVLCYEKLEPDVTLIDIGSGAGFPGIPLKIMRPDLDVICVDSLAKRVDFMNLVIDKLGLEGIKAVHSRAQELHSAGVPYETGCYVVCRAVAPLNVILELGMPYLCVGGKFIAYKSKTLGEEIEQANNAMLVLNGEISDIWYYDLTKADGEVFERNMLVVEKVDATPEGYPRGKNLIEKNPL